MNVKKILPIILLIIMAFVAIGIKRCQSSNTTNGSVSTTNTGAATPHRTSQKRPPSSPDNKAAGLDRNADNLYFTKHAKCRMKCRHITQQEVKDILAKGEINYNKSELQDPKGPTYAVEGITRDRQHVRIIFAPKQAHISVVTVIDLDEEFECSCN